MADDVESVTLISEGWRTARKEHRCKECGRAIAPGERYLYETFRYDGFQSHKTCEHCSVVRSWLTAECGGWVYTGVAEDIHEHVAEEIYGPGVRLLSVGIGMKWKRADGRLFPVPRMPPTTHQLMAPRAAT
jgi:hypothetical protein